MLWLLIVIAFAAAWLLAVLLDFVPPPHAKILIKIYEGQFKVTRGQLRAQPREFISAILREAEIARGHIAVTYYNRAVFSRNIPGNIRQRLRNVLLNPP